jgi:hypothetical protein
MIDWEFNKHRFFTDGFCIGFLPSPIRQQIDRLISTTKWVGDSPRFAEWATVPDGEIGEPFFEEMIRGRMSYGQAPTLMKNIANEVIDMEYFDPLRRILVKQQHYAYRGIRNIKPVSMGLWDRQQNVSWHNDISDGSDFFVLIYVNDYPTWDPEWFGQLLLGKENPDSSIQLIHAHEPSDSTFVVLNNMNPLFKHSVVSAGDKTRYTIGIRYVIE